MSEIPGLLEILAIDSKMSVENELPRFARLSITHAELPVRGYKFNVNLDRVSRPVEPILSQSDFFETLFVLVRVGTLREPRGVAVFDAIPFAYTWADFVV